jgi:hypothetical protein
VAYKYSTVLYSSRISGRLDKVEHYNFIEGTCTRSTMFVKH